MLSLSLLIFSSLTFATASGVPNPLLSTCILSGAPCPTGSTCTPTQTCGGLCITPVTQPPVVPCTVGNDAPCPTNAVCTPTTICATPTPCGGQCIATTNPPDLPLPSIPCVISGSNCPKGSFCTQTEVCNGLCISTPTAVTPTPTMTPKPCGGYHDRKCPWEQKCKTDRKHCVYGRSCEGICVPD